MLLNADELFIRKWDEFECCVVPFLFSISSQCKYLPVYTMRLVIDWPKHVDDANSLSFGWEIEIYSVHTSSSAMWPYNMFAVHLVDDFACTFRRRRLLSVICIVRLGCVFSVVFGDHFHTYNATDKCNPNGENKKKRQGDPHSNRGRSLIAVLAARGNMKLKVCVREKYTVNDGTCEHGASFTRIQAQPVRYCVRLPHIFYETTGVRWCVRALLDSNTHTLRQLTHVWHILVRVRTQLIVPPLHACSTLQKLPLIDLRIKKIFKPVYHTNKETTEIKKRTPHSELSISALIFAAIPSKLVTICV